MLAKSQLENSQTHHKVYNSFSNAYSVLILILIKIQFDPRLCNQASFSYSVAIYTWIDHLKSYPTG